MKKYILLLSFIFVSYAAKAQGIYFSEPTSSSVYHIPYGGSVGISYNFYHDNSIVVNDYYAQLIYPDGHSSNWQVGETGGWWVTTAGTYQIQGKAWVTSVLWGNSYWAYRDPFSFSVVADPPPPPPLTVSISGPTTAPCATGTWTANVSGGYPGYSYQWYDMQLSGGPLPLSLSKDNSSSPSGGVHTDQLTNTWTPVGSNNSNLNLYLCSGDHKLKVVVTDSHSATDSAEYYVYGSGGGLNKANNNFAEMINTVP